MMKRKATGLLLIIVFLILSDSYAQSITGLKVTQITTPIEIDGELNEVIWQSQDVQLAIDSGKGLNFHQIFPTDSLPATDDTFVALAYDNQNIYIGIVCFESVKKDPIIRSLRRDFNWGDNENVSVYFDPYNDRTNGFTFQVTPYNVQREGLVTIGGEVADDWDNKWYSATQLHETYWTVEMAIPFTSIRYNETPTWGIQILRNNLKRNERTALVPVPLQYRSSDLIYTAPMNWEEPPPSAGSNISIIPYLAYSQGKDFEDQTPFRRAPAAGFDAKIGVTNSLNLDLTVNPDFSQAEVDQQVTNLNRFEIFFPERRQFFLENQDLFAQNGFPPARPFFSRRIGIATDEDGLSYQVPILGGARLSGKIGKDWRLGALTMQTQKNEGNFTPGQNYSLGIVQRQIFARSNVSAIVVNRESTSPILGDSSEYTAFNRVFGLDYNLATADNKWEGNFYFHKSEDPDPKSKAYSTGAYLGYQVRAFRLFYFHVLVGENYNAEVGFVPRKGVFTQGTGGELNFYPDRGTIQRHGLRLEVNRVMNENFDLLDREGNLEWGFNFLNTAYIELGVNYNSVFLLDPFDPTRTDGVELPSLTTYEWLSYRIFARSDRRKLINGSFSVNYGDFYNGTRTRLRSEINYRYQPYVGIALNAEYNRIDLPTPYNSADLWLIGPRFDITFTNKLFWTTFIQYNSQIENLGLNTRLQWRYKPVSDFFIVYTDNYDTSILEVKNRALIVKFNYWFNL